MLTASEQKKFIDWFVEHIFEPNDEYLRVFAKGTSELKGRLRYLCYRGIREAVMDFWDFDEKLKHRPYRPSDIVRYFEYFKGFKTVEQRVKEQLVNDTVVKPHLSSRRTEVAFDLSHFEANCENIALLTEAHYLDKLSYLAGIPKGDL